jgi:hypothetical protein
MYRWTLIRDVAAEGAEGKEIFLPSDPTHPLGQARAFALSSFCRFPRNRKREPRSCEAPGRGSVPEITLPRICAPCGGDRSHRV